MIHGQLFGDCEPPATVPVIIFGGFCNWSVCCAVLGFWDEVFAMDPYGNRSISILFFRST